MTEGAEHHPHPSWPDSAISPEKPMSEGTEHHLDRRNTPSTPPITPLTSAWP